MCVSSVWLFTLIVVRQYVLCIENNKVKNRLVLPPAPCQVNPCLNGGVCSLSNGQEECTCPRGFQVSNVHTVFVGSLKSQLSYLLSRETVLVVFGSRELWICDFPFCTKEVRAVIVQWGRESYLISWNAYWTEWGCDLKTVAQSSGETVKTVTLLQSGNGAWPKNC